jgi:hypothetical protein
VAATPISENLDQHYYQVWLSDAAKTFTATFATNAAIRT